MRDACGSAADIAALDPAWRSATKLRAATLPLAEFAAVVGNLRAARFGHHAAWRTVASFGALDELRHTHLRRASDADPLLAALASSFDDDARWHRAWSAALVAVATSTRPENGDVLRAWIAKWTPLARAAVLPFEEMLDADGLSTRAEQAAHDFVSTRGLEARSP